MMRKGRLTITDGNNYLSGVITTLEAGVSYEDAGRVIAALSENPKTIEEFKKSYLKFSEVPIEQRLSPLELELSYDAKPGDKIAIPNPDDKMKYEFSIFVDLVNKIIHFNNINIPRKSIERYYTNSPTYFTISYQLSDEWKIEIVDWENEVKTPIYQVESEKFKGDISVAICQIGEHSYYPIIVVGNEVLDAMFHTMFSTHKEPVVIFKNVNKDFFELARELSEEMSDKGLCALESFLKNNVQISNT